MPLTSSIRAATSLRLLQKASLLLLPLAVLSCGGGGGGGSGFSAFPLPIGGAGSGGTPAVQASTYAVGGSVSGLVGSGLVLQQAGSADVAVAADGRFVFGDRRAKGASYAVTVKQQPANPPQTCTVNRGAGTVGEADVGDIAVVCSAAAFNVSVKVTKLAGGDRVVLQNNAGDDLTVTANGTFSFATPVASGAGYGVTVKTQPAAAQTCVAHGAFGTVGASDVTSVEVRCTDVGLSRFAYTPNEGSNNASAFEIGAGGSLPAPTTVAAGSSPQHMTVDPSGRYAYVAGLLSSTVFVFSIDPGTGALLLVQTVFVNSARFIAIEPQGRFAYVLGNRSVVQFAIDSATGQLGAATSFATGGSPNDFWMAIDGASRFAYLPHLDGSVDVLAIDATSGALSGPVQSVVLPVGLQAFNVALEPSGRFAYVAAIAPNPAPSRLIAYAIDPRAGTLTQVASVDTGMAGRGLGIDPTGRFVYVANVNAANVSAFAIDARTGVPTPLAGSPFATGGSGPTSISVDRTGRRVYTANQISSTVSVFDIDPVTGALSSPVQFPSGGTSPQYVALTK
ncbi:MULTISPECIES: lactonase family protein [unclassified Variovorax]|uniref:lactonase family protein n=1 Tax=unclassified Variovorax TaxID=663243 RepID=UPI000D11BC2D|nr:MULTISPECIES: beta-propeller fold lactonase family protein [unclassified Variovorax]AVQ85061.1 hypothetical protein C4F17_28825 [Variovorax sp. PMC12]QRY34678.1 beta-propeller fold lactonase family protein [Variovorax sp. PDNC026]